MKFTDEFVVFVGELSVAEESSNNSGLTVLVQIKSLVQLKWTIALI